MKHIHFIGIGGAGLSALARVMLGRGYNVSGSDPAEPNQITRELQGLGATIFREHKAEQIKGADEVVVTSAAHPDNPEIAAARQLGIPVLKRREFLHTVTVGYDVIAIAGTHGKTTTTAMIGLILEGAGLDPTVVVGGVVPEWSTNARVGASKWFVIEADEYDNAFLGLEPKIAVVTNVEYDHPDVFPTPESYQNAFAALLKQTRAEGVCIVCGDDPAAVKLGELSARELVCYGIKDGNDWQARDIRPNRVGGSDFSLAHENQSVGTCSLRIPGEHNVSNAVGAMVAAKLAGVEPDVSRAILEKFEGVGRRFQILGTCNGATIVDDYAHHPTEIRVNLSAARARFPAARLVVLFQPHTYSRTRALLDEFAEAFEDADLVLITEIFAAREHDASGLSSRVLVERMDPNRVRFVETLDEAIKFLRKELRTGDVLMTLGAGNVNQVAQDLV